jgi:tryptophan synthase alpha chain
VTGVRSSLQARVGDLVRQLKSRGETPVAVGFGISAPEQARQGRGGGDEGAIVGSALVKRMAEAQGQGRSVSEEAGRYCAELRQALDS